MENSQNKLYSQPFYMIIEKVLTGPQNPRMIISGKIKSGEIHPGDNLVLLGFNEDTFVRCFGITILNTFQDSAKMGDNVALIIQRQNSSERKNMVSTSIFRPIPGQVLATPNTIEPSFKIICKYRFLTKTEGGQDKTYPNESIFSFGINATSIPGQILLTEGKTEISAGEEVKSIISLAFPIATLKGDEFNISHKGTIVGIGSVEETKVN